PGKRPITFVRRLTSSSERSSSFVIGTKVDGASYRLQTMHSERMVRPSGPGSLRTRRYGQAGPFDEPRARVSKWPPLRLTRMRWQRESVGVVLPDRVSIDPRRRGKCDGWGWMSTGISPRSPRPRPAAWSGDLAASVRRRPSYERSLRASAPKTGGDG